jgi:hypothetical protein
MEILNGIGFKHVRSVGLLFGKYNPVTFSSRLFERQALMLCRFVCKCFIERCVKQGLSMGRFR